MTEQDRTESNSSPILAGNVRDPDAETLDNLVESQAEPAAPKSEPVPGPTELPVPTKTLTRLITRTLFIEYGWGPVLIVPADPRRKSLAIWIGIGTRVRIADDPGKLQTWGGSALVYSTPGPTPLTLIDYTGPLWASNADDIESAGPCMLSIAAVTE